MRLSSVDQGTPAPPGAPDVVRALAYRPELFGAPFSAAIDALLRGTSDWTIGERELIAAFVARQNKCPF